MERKIVIIEDNWNHFKKFREYLTGYSCYPDIDCTDDSNETKLNDFTEEILNSLNSQLSISEKKTYTDNIINEIKKIGDDVIAYIIDYELMEGNTTITGLLFHKEFIKSQKIYSKEMPCLMITHIGGNQYNDIENYKRKINDESLFDCYRKPEENDNNIEDDTKQKEKIQSFVENAYANAYARVKLAKYIKVKMAFDYRSNDVDRVLNDIIEKPDSYKNGIDKILSDCIDYQSNYDEKYIKSFLNNLQKERIQNDKNA